MVSPGSTTIWGMGIASYDLTGKGYPDVFLTSQGDNKLQTLAAGSGKPTYRNIGLQRGVNVAHPFSGDVGLPSTAWHPEFADVNDDGLLNTGDLVALGGFLFQGQAAPPAPYPGAGKDPTPDAIRGCAP